MAQCIKIVWGPVGFKMYVRLEKGAEPFPESRRDSYWFCDFSEGYCSYQKSVDDDDKKLPNSKCVPNFKAIVENESDADANGVRRLKVGQIIITFEDLTEEGDKKRKLLISARDDFVNALGESLGASSGYAYYADEISAERAAKICPEIFAAERCLTTDGNGGADTLAREEIALLRKEIAALRAEMDARQKRTDAIHNLDEKTSAK